MSANVKVAGVWKDISQIWVKKGGIWREIDEGWGNNNGAWSKWWPEGGESGPVPGTYILSPTSLFLPVTGANGYAEFNTTSFRGSISNVVARMSYESPSVWVTATIGVSGRANGNFYRNIETIASYSGRTIDHGISSVDASAITDFNSGAAIGFNFNAGGVWALGNIWWNVRLKLTIT